MQIMKFTIDDDPIPRIGVITGKTLSAIGSGHRSLTELLHSNDIAVNNVLSGGIGPRAGALG
jgi:hypothetical protein